MIGVVIATIKEYQWLITLTLSVLAAYFGSGWAGRGIDWTFALSRRRKLDRLWKQRDRLIQLHKSDREYYRWLLSGVLTVLGFLAFQLVLEGIAFGPSRFGSPEKQVLAGFVVASGRYVIGLAAYVTAINRIHDYRRLQHFDQIMARLDEAIATLEAKQALRQTPEGAHVG